VASIPIVSSFVEFFTLKEARTASGRASADAREATGEALVLVKQRGEAAEALWSAGHSAEALRLAVDAHHCAEEAAKAWLVEQAPAAPLPVAEPAAEAEGSETAEPAEAAETAEAATTAEAPKVQAPESAVARVFRAQGSVGAAERVEKLATALTKTMPRVDAQVGRAETELFDELADVRASLERGLGEVLLTPRDLKLRSAARIMTVSTLILGGAVGTYFVTRTPMGQHARASGTYNDAPDFEPSRALDGNVDTSWLLPDRTNGWIEVTINPPRAVQRLRIMNTTNVPYHDRATGEYQVQVFSGSTVLQSADGVFPETSAPQWVTHDVGRLEAVDRVRITVNSWQQYGGGIAEIAIE
jgi:hypothetical protein